MSTVKCKINGLEIICKEGDTILEAARANQIDIPTLCYFQNLNHPGACRICVVQIAGMPRLMAACTTVVKEGMEIETENEEVISSRKRSLDLICKRHRMDCEYCPDYTFCELHGLVRRYGLDDRKYSQVYQPRNADESSPSIVRDTSKCIRCRRCVATCKQQGVEAISTLNRAGNTVTGAIIPMSETNCIGCAQCVRNCPTGALSIKDETDLIWRAVNEKKTIVFGIMPSTANNLGHFFGDREDKNEIGRIAAIAKKIGADRVYDLTNLDMLALNETVEKVHRKQEAGSQTILVTSCPGAKHYFEGNDALVEVPQNEDIFSKLVRKEYEQKGISRDNLCIVYVSSCASVKQSHSSDVVLTTTEFYQWMLRACVSRFTLRHVWEQSLPESADVLPELSEINIVNDFSDALEGILGMKVQKANGITEAKSLLSENSIVLVNACPGGCVNGGGQFRNL